MAIWDRTMAPTLCSPAADGSPHHSSSWWKVVGCGWWVVGGVRWFVFMCVVRESQCFIAIPFHVFSVCLAPGRQLFQSRWRFRMERWQVLEDRGWNNSTAALLWPIILRKMGIQLGSCALWLLARRNILYSHAATLYRGVAQGRWVVECTRPLAFRKKRDCSFRFWCDDDFWATPTPSLVKIHIILRMCGVILEVSYIRLSPFIGRIYSLWKNWVISAFLRVKTIIQRGFSTDDHIWKEGGGSKSPLHINHPLGRLGGRVPSLLIVLETFAKECRSKEKAVTKEAKSISAMDQLLCGQTERDGSSLCEFAKMSVVPSLLPVFCLLLLTDWRALSPSSLITWNAVSPDLMTLLHCNGVFINGQDSRSLAAVSFISVSVFVA